MSLISCIINFKEKLWQNTPYYKLLANQMCSFPIKRRRINTKIFESVCFSVAEPEEILSVVCEGYQFSIAFLGCLKNKDALSQELSSLGYPFIENTDRELALYSYIHFGEKAGEKLMGTFSFVIYDSMRRQVFALCDKYGTYPLFYGKLGDTFLISTNTKGITAHPDFVPRIDDETLSGVLLADNSTPKTIFEDLFILEKGHFLKIKEKSLEIHSYISESATQTSPLTDFPLRTSLLYLDSGSNEILELISQNKKVRKTLVLGLCDKPQICYTMHTEFMHIPLTERTLFSAILESVKLTGVPVLSESDFLLPLIYEKLPEDIDSFLVPHPDFKRLDISEFLLSGDFFPPAVKETLEELHKPEKSMLLSHSVIGNCYSLPIEYISPPDCSVSSAGSGQERCTDILILKLRRILLSIIAKNSSPILAFFKKSTLLSLCESSFSVDSLSEIAILAYFIKLDLWFSHFMPRII